MTEGTDNFLGYTRTINCKIISKLTENYYKNNDRLALDTPTNFSKCFFFFFVFVFFFSFIVLKYGVKIIKIYLVLYFPYSVLFSIYIYVLFYIVVVLGESYFKMIKRHLSKLM